MAGTKGSITRVVGFRRATEGSPPGTSSEIDLVCSPGFSEEFEEWLGGHTALFLHVMQTRVGEEGWEDEDVVAGRLAVVRIPGPQLVLRLDTSRWGGLAENGIEPGTEINVHVDA